MFGTVLLGAAACLPAAAEAKVIHHAAARHATQIASRQTRHSARVAVARAEVKRGHSGHTLVHLAAMHRNAKYAFLKGSKGRYAHRGYYGGLQCVPFARAASGIELKGNAVNWWDAAAGVYQRGAAPEAGSVLNFRANGRMRLGHVAVVTEVQNSRLITIEHANWAGPGANKGGVARGIPVEDVSPGNDWTEVRVGLGRSGDYGSVYRTYGFIYDRPDNGVMVANRPDPAAGEASAQATSFTEVAQAPEPGRGTGDAPAPARLILDVPTRNLQ